MSIGINEKVASYLEGSQMESRMLLVIYYDEDNTYRFIANDTLGDEEDSEGITIDGNFYQNASISRGQRSESSDGSVDSIELKLSNKWQSWAAILANQGNRFNGKFAEVYEWFPDFPDEKPIMLYRGTLDKVSMTVSDFSIHLNRSMGDYDMESPNMNFDPICQYVFKDVRCGYSGKFFDCGKTLNDCITRKNVQNFGGHLSVPRELVIKS